MSDELDKYLSELDDPYSVMVVYPKNVVKFPNLNLPDKKHVIIDTNGTHWFEFVCSYDDHNGNSLGFNIWAKSKEDAEKRINAIRKSAKVDGQLFTEVNYE